MLQHIRDLLWVVCLPLSWLYGAVQATLLHFKKGQKLSVPVISVGNIHWGGTGKTPIVRSLGNYFGKYNPAIVSSGYRSQLARTGGKCNLEFGENGPNLFGDEPWMIASLGKIDVFVGKNRLKVIQRYQVEKSHGLVILDDGFQHRAIQRNVEIVLLPGERSPWDSGLIPLGNLRESFHSLKRASLILITCADKAHPSVNEWKTLVSHYAPKSVCFVAERELTEIIDDQGQTINDLKTNWGAFCGIAEPERFQNDLKRLGIDGFFKFFPDHHHYRKEDLEHLLLEAQKGELHGLVTTQKDFFKVRKFFDSSQIRLGVVDIKYRLPDEFWRAIEQGITSTC